MLTQFMAQVPFYGCAESPNRPAEGSFLGKRGTSAPFTRFRHKNVENGSDVPGFRRDAAAGPTLLLGE